MKSEGVIDFTIWDDELEHVSLGQRKKMLAREKGTLSVISPCDAGESVNLPLAQEARQIPVNGESVNLPLAQEARQIPVNGSSAHSIESLVGTQISAPACLKPMTYSTKNSGHNLSTVSQYSGPSGIPDRVKLEGLDTMISLLADNRSMPGFTGIKCEYNNEIVDDFDSDLDHVVLKKRQQMLRLREVSELSKESMMGNGGESHEGLIQCHQGTEKEDINGVNNGEWLAAESLERSASFSLGTSAIHCSSPKEFPQRCSISTNKFRSKSVEPVDDLGMEEAERTYTNQKVGMYLGSYGGQTYLPAMQYNKLTSASSNMSVKCKPYDQGDFNNLDSEAKDNKFSQNVMAVKEEVYIPGQHFENDIESVPLTDRAKQLCSRKHSSGISRNDVLLKKLASPSNSNPFDSESVGQSKIGRPWKRKKTATDSVKIALEEDAPGLLQVLIDKGVLVDEIKLYGEMESDEALDESLCEESFSELEAVISKVFIQRHSILKFASQRAAKASRSSYCLACLLALVEQSRYLQFREWPVEWGWCRDLQSFIFVFERHNRIVLERPEYGYATYFFELVNSLPLNWQIKRLVTAMKLTSCSRISVLENKPLVVGEDLSDGEAKVLKDYGWVPNTGLGTMLNFRDRVIHDRKEDTSDWSSKIGKCLVDGYKDGHLIPSDIPKKFEEEYMGDQTTQVKVEAD